MNTTFNITIAATNPITGVKTGRVVEVHLGTMELHEVLTARISGSSTDLADELGEPAEVAELRIDGDHWIRLSTGDALRLARSILVGLGER